MFNFELKAHVCTVESLYIEPPGEREIWFEISKVRVVKGKFASNL